MRYSAAIFDLDGTILENEDKYFAATVTGEEVLSANPSRRDC